MLPFSRLTWYHTVEKFIRTYHKSFTTKLNTRTGGTSAIQQNASNLTNAWAAPYYKNRTGINRFHETNETLLTKGVVSRVRYIRVRDMSCNPLIAIFEGHLEELPRSTAEDTTRFLSLSSTTTKQSGLKHRRSLVT